MPRELAFRIMMKVGGEVSMVETMYKEPTSVVRVETEVRMVEAMHTEPPTVVRVET